MVYNLIIKTLAEQDITQAVEWYAQQSEQLQQQLIEAIDYSLESIKKNPQYFQRRYGEIRIVFTQNFSFGIYYIIEENTVFVHAVLHTKQNPEIGIGRI